MANPKKVFTDPLADDNPITWHVLGVCSALAVTADVQNSLIMSIALTTVLVFSNLIISIMRLWIPHKIRMIVELAVIASLVIITDEVLKAYMPEASKKLSVFVGLIITNCIVMGRAEGFAMQNKPGLSIIDGLGNGFGYSIILLLVGASREVFGAGSFYGYPVMDSLFGLADKTYLPNGLMILPPAAFIIIGLIIWVQRTYISTERLEES